MKINKKVIKKLRRIAEESELNIDDIVSQINEKGCFLYDEDYSNYEAGKSSDGGSYGFWTNAYLLKDKKGWYIELERRTTCDAFQYCRACGTFNSHEECKPIQISL